MQTRRSYPLGEPGQVATYQHESPDRLPSAVVETFTVTIGAVEEIADRMYQWMCLRVTKANGEKFAVWLLTEKLPPDDLTVARETTSRYILQIQDDRPLEFQNKFTGKPILPALGAWQYLFLNLLTKRRKMNFSHKQ